MVSDASAHNSVAVASHGACPAMTAAKKRLVKARALVQEFLRWSCRATMTLIIAVAR
jgi:hypothetical protein